MDDGPHTSVCDDSEDCWGECWDFEELSTPNDLISDE